MIEHMKGKQLLQTCSVAALKYQEHAKEFIARRYNQIVRKSRLAPDSSIVSQIPQLIYVLAKIMCTSHYERP